MGRYKNGVAFHGGQHLT
jgi:hypothetical protein